jgi:serine/threonine protein kinase
MSQEISVTTVYKMEEELGSGDYGVVSRGKQVDIDRPVAVKRIKQNGVQALSQSSEAWIMGKLTHPNIVTVYNFNKAERFIVMEYLENTLSGYITKHADEHGLLPVDKAVPIIDGCLRGLAHAHSKSIVHGDIKPANILVAENGEPKLSDWGLAATLGGPSKRNPGSVKWASPEVLKSWERENRWECSFRSDCFSIGMVSFMLLTGRHPFGGGVLADAQVFQRIKDATVSAPPIRRPTEQVTTGIAKIVSILLAKDPEERYRDAGEALNEWEEMEYVSAPPELTPPPRAEVAAASEDLQKAENESFALFEEGKIEEAIQVLRKVLQLHRKHAPGWSRLGYLYNGIGRHQDAIEACTLAIEADPQSADAYQTRGFAWSKLRQYEKGIQDFNKTLELLPSFERKRRSQVLYQRGYAYMKSRKFREACNDAREALKVDAFNAKASWLSGITCDQ